MSKAANLAGFATAVSPPSDLTVGIITATTVSATNITGTVTGDATGLSGTPDIDVRNITGVAATFTGNVSIAGTLTYEDVTNVDSVRLITARSGVDVTGGSVVVGSAVTISSGGVLAGVVTATTGCITGTFTGATVCATTGCVTGTFTGATVCATTGCVTGTLTGATVCGGTVCATTGFSGDGANLSNIPSGAITGSLGGIRVCTYSSPGTFPVPPGTSTLKITAVGGGGNSAPGGGYSGGSGGGGSGAAGVKYLTVPPSCSSYPVTVGGAGGDTIFGGPTVFLLEGGCAGCPWSEPPVNNPNRGGCQGNCGNPPPTTTYSIVSGGGSFYCCGQQFTGGTGGPGVGRGQPSFFGKGGDLGTCTFGCPGCGFGSGAGSGFTPPTSPTCCCPGGTGSPGFMIVEW